MNTRLSRVFSHLQCSNISPKRSIANSEDPKGHSKASRRLTNLPGLR